jgi:8-oxo-dGTP pyrophosphatase MutT (NUDIX family)
MPLVPLAFHQQLTFTCTACEAYYKVGVSMRVLRSRSSAHRSALSRFFRPGRRPAGDVGRIHVAAVCYRVRGSEPEFLLVRTRSGLWTFPKGGVDRDATPADAAAREAYEEAGVTGSVERRPFVSYRHCKPARAGADKNVVLVHAHLCEVQELAPPLEGYRDPTWFTSSKAKRRLRKRRSSEFAAEVVDVIDRAAQRIRRR